MLLKKMSETFDFSKDILDKYVNTSVSANKTTETYNFVVTFKTTLDAKDIIDFYTKDILNFFVRQVEF